MVIIKCFASYPVFVCTNSQKGQIKNNSLSKMKKQLWFLKFLQTLIYIVRRFFLKIRDLFFSRIFFFLQHVPFKYLWINLQFSLFRKP